MLDASTFAYRTEAPVELAVLSERVQDGARIQDVAFKSPLSGRVSAYLILPPAPQPQADIQWILDVRRAVDIFQERFELIPGHIGYVGHSFGASLGGVIAGVEHRITAYVLMAGAAQATQIMRTWQHPLIAKARENTPPEAWEAMLVAEAPYDACHYIGQASPAVLLFQFARHDDFVPVQEAESYFELASEPKRIAWYENCHHELSKEARIDCAAFLCEQLGLPHPSQHILDLLERVPPSAPIGYSTERGEKDG